MLKIALFGVITVAVSLYFSRTNREYQMLLSLVAGLLILYASLRFLKEGLETVNRLFEATGVNSSYLKLIRKCIGRSYVGDLASSLCRDAGNQAVGEQIEMAARLLIFALGIPLMQEVLTLLGIVMEGQAG